MPPNEHVVTVFSEPLRRERERERERVEGCVCGGVGIMEGGAWGDKVEYYTRRASPLCTDTATPDGFF